MAVSRRQSVNLRIPWIEPGSSEMDVFHAGLNAQKEETRAKYQASSRAKEAAWKKRNTHVRVLRNFVSITEF